jgi:hypothetical protein
MVDVLEELRENSSTSWHTYVSLVDESLSDHELSQALQANEHVEVLHINTNRTRGNWDSLLHVIRMREILSHVVVSDRDDADEDRQVQTTRTSRFLQAIQMNSAIQTVCLKDVRVSAASIVSFLNLATSVTTFDLEGYIMETHEEDRGAHELATSLQRNTNIRTLKLGNLKDVCLLPILSSLTANVHVNELELRLKDLSFAASTRLRVLLESTATMVKVKLSEFRFKAVSFLPLMQGLINSENITDVDFTKCIFDGEESTLLFKSILRSKSNVRALSIRACNMHGGTLPATVFADILRSDSPLRSLELCSSVLTNDGFIALLSLVAGSKVKQLQMGKIGGPQKFLALMSSIPKMQIRLLTFNMCDVDSLRWKSALIRALKKNSSLCLVDARKDGNRDEIGWDELNSYGVRNRGLSEWIAAPATIPRGAWPTAIEAARAIGPDAVIRILDAVGTSVGPIQGKRSRKRPRFFSPSW